MLDVDVLGTCKGRSCGSHQIIVRHAAAAVSSLSFTVAICSCTQLARSMIVSMVLTGRYYYHNAG